MHDSKSDLSAPPSNDDDGVQPTPNSSPPPRLTAPVPAMRPPRKLNLSLAAMPIAGDLQPVTRLCVRELKKVGQMFTANLTNAFQFRGLLYKSANSFETQYQIVTGDALLDPQIARLTLMIAFIPMFAWSTFEVILMPIKLTSYGMATFADIAKLLGRFPYYKAFIEWDEGKRKHIVYHQSLSDIEAKLIEQVKWPEQEAIIEALDCIAFDSVADLCAANEDVKTRLSAIEVE